MPAHREELKRIAFDVVLQKHRTLRLNNELVKAMFDQLNSTEGLAVTSFSKAFNIQYTTVNRFLVELEQRQIIERIIGIRERTMRFCYVPSEGEQFLLELIEQQLPIIEALIPTERDREEYHRLISNYSSEDVIRRLKNGWSIGRDFMGAINTFIANSPDSEMANALIAQKGNIDEIYDLATTIIRYAHLYLVNRNKDSY